MTKLSPADRARILRLFRGWGKATGIARTVGRSRECVLRVLKSEGLVKERNRPRLMDACARVIC